MIFGTRNWKKKKSIINNKYKISNNVYNFKYLYKILKKNTFNLHEFSKNVCNFVYLIYIIFQFCTFNLESFGLIL